MYSFPKSSRLIKSSDFAEVFTSRRLKSGTYLKIHYKLNSLPHSRLGLIVSRKNHKRANKRNYMKRVIRELFRCNLPHNQHYDIVVRVVKWFRHEDFHKVEEEFKFLLNML